MKGAILRPVIIGLFIMFLAVGTLSLSYGERNGPVPGTDGVFITPYDWVIESGDDVLWSSASILVNGNLTVENGGKLVLDQVSLTMNCTVDGLIGIEVEDGGELIMNNCVVTSERSTKHYTMKLDGTVLIESSAIREVFGDPDNPWDHGIELYSDDISILNSTFSFCEGDVLHVEFSSPLIQGNRFYNNQGAAIFTNGTSSARIIGNMVYNQRFGIVSGYYSSPIIDGNEIFDIENNGILLNGFRSPRVSNNSIYRCLNGMLLWFSNARMEFNTIYENEAGYNIKVDSKPVIVNDMVRDNTYVGISVNDSVVEVYDSIIRTQEYDGVRSFNGSRVRIFDSTVRNNGDDGFQVTEANIEVHGSTITDNEGDSVFLRGSAAADIFDSEIVGGNPSLGFHQIHLEEDSSVTLYDSKFNADSISFKDEGCRVTVKRTFDFQVLDVNDDPIPDISIDIQNETGRMFFVGSGLDGIGSRYLSLYEQRDKNGDEDGKDPGERVYHTYNYSVDESGYQYHYDEIDNSDTSTIIIRLLGLPTVNVVNSYPTNGDVGVPVGATIGITLDHDIDPATIVLEISGPGGSNVIHEVIYHDSDFTIEAIPFNDLEYSHTYTVSLSDVHGTQGEVLRDGYFFTFRTAAPPEPDHDEDGIPDSRDDDDDNDGFEDVVEEYAGTDPKNADDYPILTGDDDDDDPDPGTDPDPPASGDDDDDDDTIVIIPTPPSSDDDDDIDMDPYDPVNTSDEIPEGSDGGMDYIILVVGTVIGLLVLVGVMLLIFIRSNGGQRIVIPDEQQRPPYGG